MKSISGGEVIFSIIGGMIALAAVGTGIGLAAGLGVSQQQGRLRHLGIEPETLPAP